MSNDNLALLAAAAYGKFTNISNASEIQIALTDEGISVSQAEKFADTYEILAHQPNTASGYSGTIVKNRKTKEIFVLHRGTEQAQDLLVEDVILAIGGLPYRQLMDAKAFVELAKGYFAYNCKKYAKINRL